MAVRYTPNLVNHGFDRSASPAFQMVPANGTRVLTVHGSHGLEPTVIEVDPLHPVLTIAKLGSGSHVRLALTAGWTAGVAFVAWARPGATTSGLGNDFLLEVSVKVNKPVHAHFHYVDDGKRQVTRRNPDDLEKLIADANAILTAQANVTIHQMGGSGKLEVTQDLGRVVRRVSDKLAGPPHHVDRAEDEWDDLRKLGNATADLNVFFVREFEADQHPNRDDAEAGTIRAHKMIILEDSTSAPAGTVLAHEVGHALGIKGHPPGTNPRFLMATGRRGTGRFLPKTQINKINKSGTYGTGS